MNKIILFLVIEVLMQINFLFAQQEPDSVVISEVDTLKIVKITLSDNSILFGQILAESDTLIEFKSSAGLLINFKPELIKEKENT